MQQVVIAGYLFSALLYLGTWWRPEGGLNNQLLDWISFTKLPLSEFLTLHAATLLGAIAFARGSEPGNQEFKVIFWVLLGAYALFGLGGYLFHKNKRALTGFVVLLLTRGIGFFMIRGADVDVLRSTVLKNFAMTVPMMMLVGVVSMSDDGFRPWQEDFLKSGNLRQRIWRGKPVLFVSAYYLLWAWVEWKWPESIKN